MTEQGALPGGDDRRRRGLAVWGREIPHRNRHFTGREAELHALGERLAASSTAVVGQPAQPLFGLGGVGKTEIAAEYAHRYRDRYSLVWWVRAEQPETVITSLIALGQRIGVPDLRVEERDYSVSLVLDALNRGDPYDNYLLIFDNATDANIVQYLPNGPGHVIVTSRHSQWRKALRDEGIEVREFKLEETVDFLRRRVPALAVVPEADDAVAEERSRHAQAVELAEALGNLPIAAEHAAAYLVETGTPVAEYLQKFRANAHHLLAEDVDIAYPRSVATTWSVSRGTLSAEADALFELLAFFSPDPVFEELLVRPGVSLPGLETLERVTTDASTLRAAARQLSRFSLVRVDGVRNAIQVHRVVQAVTQGRLEREDPEKERALRAAAHTLLANSDPGTPDRDDSHFAYERSLPHLVPSGALESGDPAVRRLVLNQVRRLYQRGGHEVAIQLGELALERWRARFGRDDRQTLALAVEVARALRFADRWREAMDIDADSLTRLRENFGEADETYLVCARNYGVDLTYQGRYQEALDNDLYLLPLYERVFRPDHLATLQVRNNIAVSLRCLGRFEEALEYDEATLEERERVLGDLAQDTLISRFAIAADYRRLGRYEDALDLIRQVNETNRYKGEPWTPRYLMTAMDLGISLRRVGLYEDAAAQGEEVYERYVAILGAEHRETLRMAINLINDRRLVNDLGGARRLGEATVAAWEKVAGPDHPNTVAARSNLAIVLRVSGNPKGAVSLQESALQDFIRIHGEDHPNPLVAQLNLASDLAAIGEVRRARELGEDAYVRSIRVRGAKHPCTLAVANNLSTDRRADGDETGAQALHEETLAGYLEVLGAEHPDTRLCMQHGRTILDIEPMMN